MQQRPQYPGGRPYSVEDAVFALVTAEPGEDLEAKRRFFHESRAYERALAEGKSALEACLEAGEAWHLHRAAEAAGVDTESLLERSEDFERLAKEAIEEARNAKRAEPLEVQPA